VISVRGPGGGYNLAREARSIYIAEVITAVDENVDTTRCGGAHDCKGDGPCLTHDLWMDLSDRIYGYLNNISLRDLVERGGSLEPSKQPARPTETPRRNGTKVRLDPVRSTDGARA
jgi:Rrf2 family iron-sulfur cluster assembly transcriptional regulator